MSRGVRRLLRMAGKEYPVPRLDERERVYIDAGTDPPWERVWHDGVDVTDRPETWAARELRRRTEYLSRHGLPGIV